MPISLVYRPDLVGDPVAGDDGAPCLLYGYGSYEASMDPTFSSLRLSLLDRGFVFAIAHVRGGGEMGRHWYEEGKFVAKPNTFSDFVACARHLVGGGWTSPERLAARGGSAGGLLMGAVANLAPDLFRAVVAEVPFVDCLTTILDETLPLTVLEWEEWGNPVEDPEIYRVMKSYSPYDNVAATGPGGTPVRYPDILATAGLSDPRVGFWSRPSGWPNCGRPTRRTASCSRPRWVPATADPPVATTHGGRGVRLRLHPRRSRPGRCRATALPGGRTWPEPATCQPDIRARPWWWSRSTRPTTWSGPMARYPGVAADDGANVATNGVRRVAGSTTGMVSTWSVRVGVPNCTVVDPAAWTFWTVPAVSSPAQTVLPVVAESTWTQHDPVPVRVI